MFGAKNICENQQKIYDNTIDVFNKIQQMDEKLAKVFKGINQNFQILDEYQKDICNKLNQIESLIKQIQDKKEVNND